MTGYSTDVFRDPASGSITRVDVRDGTQVIGGWKEPHPDVWSDAFSEKDYVRELVREALGRRVI